MTEQELIDAHARRGDMIESLAHVPPREPHPLALLEKAIDAGMDPEKLKALMDLAERWLAQQAKRAYTEAMPAAQSEMPAVTRNAENTFTKSRYAQLEAIDEAIRPVYTRHGFSISFNTAKSEQPNHIRMVATVNHRAGHSESFTGDFPLDAGGLRGNDNKTAIQATGSTYSYARRYLTCLAFNVVLKNEDDDGQAGGTLNGDQIGIINDLIEEIRSQGKPFDFAQWMTKWIGVIKECRGATSLDEVPIVVFPKIIQFLELRRRAPLVPNGGKP